MSMEQEVIVREFLGPNWFRLPYDWATELGEEGLECMQPIPDAVWGAYHATRNNADDRERDKVLYGRKLSEEDRLREMLRKRAEAGLSLVPPVPDHYAKLSAVERKRYDAHWEKLQSLADEMQVQFH